MCWGTWKTPERSRTGFLAAIFQAVDFSDLMSRIVCFEILNVTNQQFTLLVFICLYVLKLLFWHFELKELKISHCSVLTPCTPTDY